MHSFKTIQGRATGEYEEKRSRFIAQLAHVETEDEALSFLSEIRAAHPLARHNVYAYILNASNRVRYSDDGEPSKTSGIPTLQVLEHAETKDIICVTTRYFGGTLLGTGGLVRAYTKAAQAALETAQLVMIEKCSDLSVRISYHLNDTIHHLLKANNVQIVDTFYSDVIEILIRIPSEKRETVEKKIVDHSNGSAIVTFINEGLASFAGFVE